MSRVDLLRRTELFADLPEDILEAAASSLGKRTFARGMVLFHKGSPGRRLYLVDSGQVRIFVLNDEGQEITLNIHSPGQCFGELALLDGGPRSAGAVAMEHTVTYTLDRDDFLDLVEQHPRLARRALELVSERLRRLTAHVESLTFLDIYGRMASCLLDLAQHHGQPGEEGVALDLHMTQAELASCVAATRESVNRALGSFRDEGLIRLEGQAITILDLDGLKSKVSQ
ncbi:MAG: Crp/Fnr family transcriptional regulator [Anaerolineae bacterium]